MSYNLSLNAAQRKKNDEFYTQLSDIQKELRHYKPHFKDKTVYCNCDDPTISNFWKYFSIEFERLGLKKLMATCYKNSNQDLFSDHTVEKSFQMEYFGGNNDTRIKYLKGDGDFRSAECIELLKQADIIVTNPPFSLFREYIAQLIKHEKQFLILGNMNAITCKDIFPLIKENRMWLGYELGWRDILFDVPDDYALELVETKKEGSAYRIVDGVVKGSFRNITWFTNLDHSNRYKPLELFRTYTPQEYPTYDNCNAINVSKTANIPKDYDGLMGVPITFLKKHCPEQFDIIGFRKGDDGKDLSINGDYTYIRILIKKKQSS